MAQKGVNKVILIGNVGQEPDVRFTPSGSAVANLSVATGESWKDQQGQVQEKTEWHRVVVFGKLAEVVQQYIHKGSKVYLEGKLQTRKWQDNSGQDRYTTEVVLDSFAGVMQMLDPRQQQGHRQGGYPQQAPQSNPQARHAPAQRAPSPAQGQPQPLPGADDFDDDIPF